MIRERVPAQPGVYGYLDGQGRLLYVGKSKSLRHRLLGYQATTPSDPKMTRIVRHARGMIWEPTTHELLALIREQELITRWQPSMNRMGQPLRRQPVFVRIDRGPAAMVGPARRASIETHHCFGPIPGTKEVGQGVIALAYAFGLRDCQAKTPMHFRDQLELFAELRTPLCLRHELGSCPAPCAGGCSRGEYDRRVARAVAFLEGEDRSILAELQVEMFRSAEQKRYERAAICRDRFDRLSWLEKRLERLRQARRDLHGLFPLPGLKRRQVWLVLRHGLLSDVIAVTSSPEDRETLARIAAHAALPGPIPLPESMHEVYVQMILHGWFRKHPEDLDRLVPFDRIEVGTSEPRKKESASRTGMPSRTAASPPTADSTHRIDPSTGVAVPEPQRVKRRRRRTHESTVAPSDAIPLRSEPLLRPDSASRTEAGSG